LNPYLFGVDTACSGTTLLQRVLNWSSGERAQPYVKMRYEDADTSTEAELSRLREFPGIPFGAAIQIYHVGRTGQSRGAAARPSGFRPLRGCAAVATAP
jgi:hypothetical protein